MMHWRLSSVLVILFCVATAAQADEAARSALPDDIRPELQVLTPNSLAYGWLEVRKYWSGEESAALKEISSAHPVVLTWWALHLEKRLGCGPQSIERVIFVVPRFGDFLAVITTKKGLDHQKLLSALTQGAEPELRNGKSYYTNTSQSIFAVSVNESSFAVGSAAVAELVLNPENSMAALKLRQQASASLRQQPLLVAHLNVPSLELTPDQVPEELRPLLAAHSWCVRFEPCDQGLSAVFEASFADTVAARQSVPALNAVVGFLDRYLAMAGTNMPAFFKQQASEFPKAPVLAKPMKSSIAAARIGVQAARASQVGTEVQVSTLVNTEQPVTTAVLLLSLMPRAPKDAAGSGDPK